MGFDVGGRSHGTESAYAKGCRCVECRGAAQLARRERAVRKAEALNGALNGASTGLSAVVTPIGGSRTSGESVVPASLEAAIRAVIGTLNIGPDDVLTLVKARLAVDLARQIDSPSTSMSVAPIVAQFRASLAELEAAKGEHADFGGLAGLFGSR